MSKKFYPSTSKNKVNKLFNAPTPKPVDNNAYDVFQAIRKQENSTTVYTASIKATDMGTLNVTVSIVKFVDNKAPIFMSKRSLVLRDNMGFKIYQSTNAWVAEWAQTCTKMTADEAEQNIVSIASAYAIVG